MIRSSCSEVSMTGTEWLESGGGPLILLPHILLPEWRGTGSTGDPISQDYERACQHRELLSPITVSKGTGLVLSGDVLPCAWWEPIAHAEGALVRWEYADDEADVEQALRSGVPGPSDPWLAYEVVGPLRLFDSAWPGNEAPEFVEVDLPLGTYHVTSEWVRPSERVSLLVHRFKRRVLV